MLRRFGWSFKSRPDAEAPLLDWSLEEDGLQDSPQPWQRGTDSPYGRGSSSPIRVPSKQASKRRQPLERSAVAPIADPPRNVLHSSGTSVGSQNGDQQKPFHRLSQDPFDGFHELGAYTALPSLGGQYLPRPWLTSKGCGARGSETGTFPENIEAARPLDWECGAGSEQMRIPSGPLSKGQILKGFWPGLHSEDDQPLELVSEVEHQNARHAGCSECGKSFKSSSAALPPLQTSARRSSQESRPQAEDAEDNLPKGFTQFVSQLWRRQSETASQMQDRNQERRPAENERLPLSVDCSAPLSPPSPRASTRRESRVNSSRGSGGRQTPAPERGRSTCSAGGPGSPPRSGMSASGSRVWSAIESAPSTWAQTAAAKEALSYPVYWQGGCNTPSLHPSVGRSLHFDRSANAFRQWQKAFKWVLLWLALSCLTIMHSAALIFSLGYSLFAVIFAAMFTWSGLLGVIGAARALLGFCLAQHKHLHNALQTASLKATEMLSFTTAILSGVAALIHLVSIQIVMHNTHLPSCGPSDRSCAESYDMIIVMLVATTVLYGCHSAIAAIVAYSAHATAALASAPALIPLTSDLERPL